MSLREGQSSGVAEAALRPTGGPPAPLRPGSAPGAGLLRTLAWEELYLTLPPAQQQELLTLAERQGILYAPQLPAPGNATPLEPERRLLAQLLRGQIDGLQPVCPGPVAVFDSQLDAVQR